MSFQKVVITLMELRTFGDYARFKIDKKKQ